jgi:hypothetical protein
LRHIFTSGVLVSAFALTVHLNAQTLPSETQTDEPPFIAPEQGCSFKSDPVEFLSRQSREQQNAYNRTAKLSFLRSAALATASPVSAASIPRRNFIDEHIFGKLQNSNVPSAILSSDEEFVRRVHLDITGRIPTSQEVKEFTQSADTKKRADLIERLLASPAFNDKWTVWFMDLVGMTDTPSTGNRRPQFEGRNAFHKYIRNVIEADRSLKSVAYDLVTGTGNTYGTDNGPANFAILGSAAMGPVQDTYDMMLYRSATSFLGVSHYDCLLCHNGRGHLDQISVWGTRTTRMDAQRMSAHFARTRLQGVPNLKQYEDALYNSSDVQDAATGTYDLNTNFGNRPGRCANGLPLLETGRCLATQRLTPEYRDGSAPGDGNWRAAFAKKLIEDPLFDINFANRIWKAFFSLALIDPVDTIDPDRLDPKNPPPAPWALQATHPELLLDLAFYFKANGANLRQLIREIVNSSAYQLSSRYDGPWKLEYVPLFARHYPRRLQAEEVHDALAKASGVFPSYTWATANAQTLPRGTTLPQSEPVQWAMQLPDVTEPRSNVGNGNNFMAAFLRGNRDTTARSTSGSMVQQLNLMNDQFVTTRIKTANSPVLREIAKLTESSAAIDELFLTFLSRKPTASESEKAQKYLNRSTTAAARNTALEDLAWMCINKLDFLFNY